MTTSPAELWPGRVDNGATASRRSIGTVTPDQLVDHLGAELTIVGLGLLLGAVLGTVTFMLQLRREGRALWPR